MKKLRELSSEEFCYLTTVGRKTGRPHEIEIWFAVENETLYMLSGARDRSDWVRNLVEEPKVSFRVGGLTFEGRARLVEDESEDSLARDLLVEKYERSPGSLTYWRKRSLPVAVDLSP